MMERIFLLISALIICSVRFNAQECPATLVHYWNLEEDNNGFEDIVGDLNAQVENPAIKVVGIVNSAQYFNGLSEINIPGDATFNWGHDDNFSIEFWIKKTSQCPQNQVTYNNVVIGRDDPSSELHWWAGVSCVNEGKINFTMFSKDGNGYTLISNATVNNGNWHHIVIVRDGNAGNTILYVDGILDSQVTHIHTDDFISNSPVNIGWLNLDSKYHLDASIDELAVYSSAIDESVINEHYNNGSGRDYCTGLVTDLPAEATTEISDLKVLPNIIRDDFRIAFKLFNDQHVEISLLDISGREIHNYLSQKLPGGDHVLGFSLGSMNQSSVAILRIKLQNKIITRKIMMQ